MDKIRGVNIKQNLVIAIKFVKMFTNAAFRTTLTHILSVNTVVSGLITKATCDTTFEFTFFDTKGA